MQVELARWYIPCVQISKAKSSLLGPKSRRVPFIAGWLLLFLGVLLTVDERLRSLQLATSALGVGLLITSVALTGRSILWRQNASEMRIKSLVKQLLKQDAQSVKAVAADKSDELKSLLAGMSNAVRPLNKEDLELLYLLEFSTGRVKCLQLLGLKKIHGEILFLTTHPNLEAVEQAGKLLGLQIHPIGIDDCNSVIWDVGKYAAVLIERGSTTPNAIVPFSWVKASALVLSLDNQLDSEYLRALNYGLPVGFAFEEKKNQPDEIIVRRSLE